MTSDESTVVNSVSHSNYLPTSIERWLQAIAFDQGMC